MTSIPLSGAKRQRYTAPMNIQPNAAVRAAITGVVLAGGEGSRLGYRDKALLIWRQRPFIAHILEGLRPQVAQVIVNSHSSAIAAAVKTPMLPDPFPERRGPLAGILAGLNYAVTPFTLFVPCDNPHIPCDLAPRLHAALNDSGADIAYAATSAGDHYLHVLIRTTLRERLRLFLESGQRAVRQWYAQENSCRVEFDDDRAFANINTPEALNQLSQ